MHTATELKTIKATGVFEVLTDSKYLTSGKYLQDGNIIMRNGHTAVAIEVFTVKDLQMQLNTFGYELKVDGIREPKTNVANKDLHDRAAVIDNILSQ